MRRALILAAALAACAPTPEADPAPDAAEEPPAAGSASLPPPWPEGVAVRIVSDDAGKTIRVRAGEPFAIALVGVPTAGYAWRAEDLPAFLEAAGEASGPTHAAQRQPGFTGGDHWEVLSFRAKAPGSATLRLAQRRPWETAEPPSQTFEIAITAQ